jgi:hypothetical protein
MATVDFSSPALGSFNSQLSSFPIWKYSRVEDLLTPILNNQMVLMNSDSPAFRSSHISTNTNPRSEFSQSDRSSATCPLQINDPGSLWEFGSFRPIPNQWSLDLLLNQHLRYPSGLQFFRPLLSSGVLHTQSSKSNATRLLSYQQPRFTLAVSPPPCPKNSEVVDLMPLVLLDDGQSKIT